MRIRLRKNSLFAIIIDVVKAYGILPRKFHLVDPVPFSASFETEDEAGISYLYENDCDWKLYKF